MKFKTDEWEQISGFPEEMEVIDVIEVNIRGLQIAEKKKDFSAARVIMENIVSILDEPNEDAIVPENERCRTLLAVHQMLRAHPIRLRYKVMDISGYFQLLINVRKRLFNKNADVNTQRQVVAEEMAKLHLHPQVLTEKWQLRECKPPNRAFMDVLIKIKPELAKEDVLRREYTKLQNAWERGDKKSMRMIEESIKKIEVSGNVEG